MNKLFFSNIQPGTLLFNRFEAVRVISATDVGGVYLCHDTANAGEEVALKVIANDNPICPIDLDAVRREMLITSAIDHPHVVRSQSFFQDTLFSAFTMEYHAGGTLADMIEKYKSFSSEYVEKALYQLCSGLRAIHREGIIHRDIKPENILIDAAGNLKIADFGIALPAEAESEDSAGNLVGTMNYLSPEYIEHGKVDVRSDIYALGIIGYELITGKPPFEKKSLIESLTSRVKFDPETPWALRKECPRGLSDIIMKAINRNPSRRFQNAQEMFVALESLKEGEEITLAPAIQALHGVLRSAIAG